MKFTALELPGARLVEPEVDVDRRGASRRHFRAGEYATQGICTTVVQDNVSENPQRGPLRGFHYRASPAREARTLSCFAGALYDIIVDLRPNSPTFMKWVAVEFSAWDRGNLHVPAGCANAWLTTMRETIVHYYVREFYATAADRGLRCNDPAFCFRWPLTPTLISEKDQNYPECDPRTLEA